MNSRIIVAFCALFLAQALVIHAKPEPNNLEGSEIRDGAADAAKKIFLTLMAVVDKALQDASDNLNAAVQSVNETVIDFENKAHDAINLAMDPINAKLKEYVEEAEKQGINITKCENYIDELTALPNNLSDDMVECMTDKLFQATSYVDDVLANIQVIDQEMSNFTKKIDDCEGNIFSEAVCLAALTAEMTKDTIDVPVKIAADVTKAKLLIEALIPEVGICYTASLAKVPIQGLDIVGKFALCVGLS